MSQNDCILIIPDLHCPYEHPDTIPFLKKIKEVYRPTRTIQLGDEIEGATFSFHEKDPDTAFSPSSELENAIEHLKPFYELFPDLDILESNHGSLIYRRAKFAGLPKHVIKSYSEILEAPAGWSWHFDMNIPLPNGTTLYLHHGMKKNAALVGKEYAKNHACGH